MMWSSGCNKCVLIEEHFVLLFYLINGINSKNTSDSKQKSFDLKISLLYIPDVMTGC